MPRRRRTVYRSARRAVRTARGGWGGGLFGKLKPIIVGAAGGFAYGFGKNLNAQFGGPGALAAVGYFGNNETLMTLSGIELAQNMGAGLTQQSGTAGGWL
jgi:hypothetical protein